MEKSNLKNIVVLKDLPSNIVDEAIVILKPNSKIKKLELVDKNKGNKAKKSNEESNKHVLKEAEMLIATYLSKIEKKQKKANTNELLKKYKKLRSCTILISIVLLISMIFNIFNIKFS